MRYTRTFPGLAIVIALTGALAACHSGGGGGVAAPASPSASVAPSATPSAIGVIGVVNTADSGCNDDVKTGGKPGDCWLPLYAAPAVGNGTVLNEDVIAIDSMCRSDGDESQCWPQPLQTVTVLCEVRAAQGIFVGIDVPLSQVLTPDAGAAKSPSGGVIGYNFAKWVKLPNGRSVASLPHCQ